jgi:hypothetical protein
VLAALLVAVVASALAAAMMLPAGAVVGPFPAGPATVNVSTPTSGLVNGSVVTYTAGTTGTATLSGAQVGHICATPPGGPIDNSTDFGYQGVYCVKQAGITSGNLGLGDYSVQQTFSGVTTTTPQNFHAGVGTVTWIDDLFGLHTLTCGPGNPCDLVIQVNYNQSPASSYFTQQLTFAGPPAAPSALAATAGNAQASLTWTDGANNGSPITNHQVNVTPAPASGPCASGTCLTGSTGTSFTVPNLTNFTPYSFTVQSVNALGASPVSNTASATPGPAGPTLAGSPADSQVSLGWTAVGGATNYRVTVNPHPSAGPCASGTCLTGNVLTFIVPNLTNGTAYTFTVAGQVGANFTAESNAIILTPNGSLIHQTISVDRPQGTLVISQFCSGQPVDLNGNFDPSNNNGNYSPNPVPNTNCNLQLSGTRPFSVFSDAITASPRTVHDAVTSSSTTVTSATAAFVSNDVNQLVTGTGIPAGARIASVTNATTIVLSVPATLSFDGGDLSVVGSTVNFAAPHGFAAADVNMEIEGLQIPGGSHITNVVSTSAVDISAPADAAATGMSVREWTHAPTPAHLITTGPHAGQYFEATGQIRQVMIVDTRPADTGWTATGQVTDFTDPSTLAHFSGNNLGWAPKTVHAYSQPFNSPDGPYSMSPAKGASVAPGSVPGLKDATSASTDTTVPGSVPGSTLAYTQTGHGLGLAQLDADLLLWIPVQNQAGHYSATLTLTAI